MFFFLTTFMGIGFATGWYYLVRKDILPRFGRAGPIIFLAMTIITLIDFGIASESIVYLEFIKLPFSTIFGIGIVFGLINYLIGCFARMWHLRDIYATLIVALIYDLTTYNLIYRITFATYYGIPLIIANWFIMGFFFAALVAYGDMTLKRLLKRWNVQYPP